MIDPAIQNLTDRADTSSVLHTYATAIDKRDWDLLTTCFTEDLEADFRDFGGRHVIKGRAAWVDAIKGTINGLDATQHLTANHVHKIDGNNAIITAYLQAVHRLEGARSDPEYTVGGYYTCDMVRSHDGEINGGWRIRRYKLTVTWHRGNRDILRQARRRLQN